MESNYLIPMGKRLGEIRRSHNFTPEKLANMLEVTPKHISHTERGKSSLSLINLIEFCSIFDSSLDYIVLGKTTDSYLSKLPIEIIEILNTGNDAQINRINKVLEMYLELSHGNE